MMAFGISFEQARNSVWGALRKNGPMLGPTQRPYANLLLQAYENMAGQAAGGQKPGGAAPGPATGGGGVPADIMSFTAQAGSGATPAAAAVEDDFEAIALGLPPQPSGDLANGTIEDGGDEGGIFEADHD